MFDHGQLDALDRTKMGTSARMAYALILWCYGERGCTYDFLATQMGVSLDRAQRVVADLRRANLARIEQEYKQPVFIYPVRINQHESDHS